ncbi:MAG TPA: alanine--tRNA ligase [Candidatus Saccharimonadales bacterium]|nr:alanine--tRNA ligase [Candidatus Saccharimonadales bacterium]
MNAQQIRQAYLDFFQKNGHAVIPRALLVPQNDPTTLFTGSGMQPLVPYLLGEAHPDGTRLVDSQTCIRVQDIEEVGDNRHTTFFEMLGNWSLGDYFKKEQIPWFWEFLTQKIGLDPKRIFVTCFSGDDEAGVPKDEEAADIWTGLFTKAGVDAKRVDIGTEENGYKVGDQGGRIFFYSGKKNWWSRAGTPAEMPVGEPGGPTTEMFYLFPEIQHNPEYGEHCHVNCDCGRYIELGNSVFMSYVKTADGVQPLPKQNVDYGGGLERIAAAAIDSPDVFKISLLWPIVQKLEELSGKTYDSHTNAMRVIADHLRGAAFLAVDGVVPSNKEQGYVMRRLVRRAIRFAFDLGIEQALCEQVVPVITELYKNDFPEVAEREHMVIDVLMREEKLFRQTLRKGLHEFGKLTQGRKLLDGEVIFKLYDTYGFPVELSIEEAYKNDLQVQDEWRHEFEHHMAEQKARSQTAAKGTFKGGLADHSEITTKYHTATHLMYRALRMVLGDHVIQRGSNITAERLRFDFSHPEKVTPEQLAEVEKIVNEQIDRDWPMSWREENTKEALAKGVMGAFGDRYGDMVKVYTVGDPDGENYSREICGGPHVEHTGALKEGGRAFKIVKEEASSAGVRRIKAELRSPAPNTQ